MQISTSHRAPFSISSRTILDPWTLGAFLLLTILCLRLHEYAHVVAAIVHGFGFQSEFARVKILTDDTVVDFHLAGPVLSFTFLVVGLALMLRSQHWRNFGFWLIFASTPLFRMTGYMFSTIPGRDESSALLALHIHPLLAVLVVWGLAIPPLVIAYRTISPGRRVFSFFLLFMLIPMGGYFILQFGDYALLPLLNHFQASRPLLSTLFGGVPIIVLMFDLATIALYLCISRLTNRRLRVA